VRLIVAALLVGFVVAGIGDGWWSSPSAEPVVQSFLLDWQDHAYAAAAGLTTGRPTAVTTELDSAYRQLDAASFSLSMGYISQHGHTATAHFYANIDLGQNGQLWNYRGTLGLHLTPAGWKIAWSPSVINPALRRGLHLAIVSTTRARRPLLDAEGQPLQILSPVYVVGVQPDRLKSPQATAQALGRVTGIDSDQLQGWIEAGAKKQFLELITLSPIDYHQLAHALHKVPGPLVIQRQKMRLFNSIAPAIVGTVGTESSAALRDQGIAYRPGATWGLSGLQQHYQNNLAGSPGTEVVTETNSGRQVSMLKTWSGRLPSAVRTTIDFGVQRAAARAVAAAPGSAAIVAMQAGTGHILAVAEHKGRRMPTIDPLAGRYPPGAAFSIVSTEAALANGLQTNQVLPCQETNPVDGQYFQNIPAERLRGSPTFATDFAHSCSTALVGLSYRGGMRQDLANAAKGFGLGADWQLPLPSFSGQVGVPGEAAQLAAVIIGQGGVQVSPLTMAGVAAQVDSGIWHEPLLVTKPDPGHAEQARFSAGTITSLQGLMRQAVRSGSARRANVRGAPVYGQVGTASMDGPKRHQRWATWFVGYRGDIAFAVLEISGSSRASAAPLAASFLRIAPSR
jgi:cell division protein FtsI/penicillin-binding protein 2